MDESSPSGVSFFTFGDDGFFHDPFGEPCVLIGTVEFSTFCHQLDASFESPLGRKLIYAATDAEERLLSGHPSVQFGRWFGKSKAKNRLRQRAIEMGWGGLEDDHIISPAHDAMTVGFSLAHHEHLDGQRAHVEWNQSSADFIRLRFSSKGETITPAPAPHRLPWFGADHDGGASGHLDVDLDSRAIGFFKGEERSFFLSTQVFWHLFGSLLGRPLSNDFTSQFHLKIDENFEHPNAFHAVVHSACLAFEANQRPVYVQSPTDWDGHFHERITERGFGIVRVEQSILAGEEISIFSIKSPVAPVAVGLLVGMWQRAHGAVADVRVEGAVNTVRVYLSFRRVDYV